MLRNPKPLSIAVIALFVFGVITLVGNLHYASVLTDEAIEKERRPHLIMKLYGKGYRPDLPKQIVLLHPMECAGAPDATVNQRIYIVEAGRTRCYSRSEK